MMASVMVAEDDFDTRLLVQYMLESAGFDVTLAEDGAQAWRSLDDSQPDLVLTDLNMPEVSGVELIERIRSAPHLAAVPVIAMSAYGSDSMARARRAGAAATIQKPDGLFHLVETIERVLHRGDQRPEQKP